MIELRGVSKTVESGGRPLTILHPLDLSIRSGEFLAIVGPSGSGKSTLLGLLAGLDAASTGEIVIDGVDITKLTEDALAKLRGEKIGFVFQFFHLVPSLTAFENILVPMEIARRRDAVDQDAAGGGRIQSREQPEQRGLAAARGPDDGDELARGDREVKGMEDGQRTVAAHDRLGDATQFDHSGCR